MTRRLLRQAEADATRIHAKFLDVAGHGIGVDTSQQRHADRVERSGDRLVGFHHEHLDDLVGEGLVLGHGVDDVAVVVEHQLDLGQVEDDHAVAVATLLDDSGQTIAVA